MSEWSSESQIKSYEDIDEEKGKVHVEGKENTNMWQLNRMRVKQIMLPMLM